MAHKRPHEFFEKKKKQLYEQVLEKKISKKKIADKYLIEKLTKKSPGKVKNKRGWYKTYCTWKIRKEIIRKQK